jgi:hypothetical protein
MNSLKDIEVNLAASGMAFLLGLAARTIWHRLRTRRGRQFWGSGFLRRRPVALFGSWQIETDQEPAGLVGQGDARALKEVAQILKELGMDVDMSFADRLNDGEQGRDLILIGAEEVNALSRDVVDEVGATFRFDYKSPPIELVDVKDPSKPVRYSAEWIDDNNHDLGISRDYAVLLRANNPADPRRTVLIFGGLYGFGTWACPRFIQTPMFKEAYRDLIREHRTRNFECLLEVKVIEGLPYRSHIVGEKLRPLAGKKTARRWTRALGVLAARH